MTFKHCLLIKSSNMSDNKAPKAAEGTMIHSPGPEMVCVIDQSSSESIKQDEVLGRNHTVFISVQSAVEDC